ncbi:histidine phosphatase family protein [Natronorarus salvus]|uniref:histidine phosphatase family protein n=1 Tax=Natronorarus salvus TaxID=3117733 RepID=UPI002F261D05
MTIPSVVDTTRLLLIRHGQTAHNRKGITQGHANIPLEEKGIKQAKALRNRLENESIDQIYASDLDRASQTATIVAEPHDLTVNTATELRERSFGIYEGRSKNDLIEVAEAADEPYSTFRPCEGENVDDAVTRSLPKIEKILQSSIGETILIVAHGSLNRAIISSMLCGDCSLADRFSQENTAINEISYNGDWNIKRVNDSAHLDFPI